MKFCMVTTFYPPYTFGGDGIFVYRLANELAQRGHRVEVVHCIDAYRMLSPRRVEPHQPVPHHPHVTTHGLHSGLGMLSPLITHQTGHPGLKAPRLREILNDGRFDVIHFHNISLIGPVALSYGSGVKLYTLHEHWLVCPLHVLWKFNRGPCSRRHCLPCTVHARRPPQWWRSTGLLDGMLRHVDAIIAPSRFTAEKHRAMGLETTTPVVHLPHFLPQEAAPETGRPDPPPHPRPYFVFAGRLEKMKGGQVLVEAFRRYRDADLLVAGTGTFERTLRAMARGLPHVVFLGRLEYDRLQAVFRHAVAVLVPSLGYEVFPMVLLEAFAQRTPVVVHNLGPLPEIVGQSGGGLVYDDEAGLLEGLRRLAADPGLRRTLGERGYRAYLQFWTPEPHFRQYFHLIESIAARRSAAGRSAGGPASGTRLVV